jgi:outer membrane protein assembly factor BamB
MKSVHLLLIVMAATFCHAADWPMFRGNSGRTGFYPDPVGFPTGAPAWKVSLGGAVVSSPVVSGGVLYIGSRDSCIHALDCKDGSEIWKVKTGGWVDATPLINGERVYAGSRDSSIYVLDRNSGAIFGRLSAGVQMSSPVITADGSVLVGLGLPSQGLACYGPTTLAKEVKVRAGPQWTIPLPQYTYSSPALNGQIAVAGATNGAFYGIDISRKDTLWSLATKGVVYLSTPAIEDTIVYVAPGDDDNNVYAVSLVSGKVFWKNEGLIPSAFSSSAVAKKNSVRIIPPEDNVRLLRMSPAFRKRTIQSLLRRRIDLPRRSPISGLNNPKITGLAKTSSAVSGNFISLDGMKTSSVTIGANNVYVARKDLGYILVNDSLVEYKQQFSIQAFDKYFGDALWSFGECRASPEIGYCSSPVATNNMVFFGWGEGRIYGLDATTGVKLWEDSLDGHILSSPAIAVGKLYVATMNGVVYAFDLSATAPGMDFETSTYCYPNPARGNVSHLQVYVKEKAEMSLHLYSLSEKPVLAIKKDLVAGQKYVYDWNLDKVANGAYIAQVFVRYQDGRTEKKNIKIAVLK